MSGLYNKNKECKPHSKCNNFKQCDYCARLRQSETADIVELASRFSDNANYTVVMPATKHNNSTTIKAIKSNIVRKLRQSTNGSMISVETTANNALHLNIISTSDNELSPVIFQKALKNLGVEASIFSENISKNDIRKVSAYSIKRQNIPTSEEYQGNTLNFGGEMKTAKQVMQGKKMINYCPQIALASMLNTLERLNVKKPIFIAGKSKTRDEAIKRLLELAEETDKLGYCYHQELGIIHKDRFIPYFNRTAHKIAYL